MAKLLYLFLFSSILFSCQEVQTKQSASEEKQNSNNIDFQKIVNSLTFDVKKVSYAYGQHLRFRVNRESMGKVIENQFIDSYLYAKNNKVDLNVVNQKMYASKEKSERDPSFLNEYSQNLGLSVGAIDAANDFIKQLDLVEFAEGFKDAGAYINKLKINPDSLYFAEQANFQNQLGKKFLELNRSLPGVKSTASGLQYKIIKQGTGAHPDSSSEVTVHYTGKLISGQIFDSSVQRGMPLSFNLQGVIKGWTEGLQLMNSGAKFEFYIPQELAYGSQQAGSIPANSTLIFEVELISFK